jgi:hypothetical protein
MFYNGFNLLLDVAIASVFYWTGYKFGRYDGYVDGAEAEADIRDAFENYYLDNTKENNNA